MRINKSRKRKITITPEIFSHAARRVYKMHYAAASATGTGNFLKSDIFSATCVFRMKRKERKKE